MRDLLYRLLDIRTLNPGDPGVEFGFARPIPLWGWALVVLCAAALAWMSYRRLEGPAAWRVSLAGVRAGVIVLLAVLIAGPRLIKPNESEERDWVVVLVDRSASMSIRDSSGVEGAPLRTRDEELIEAIEGASGAWGSLAADRVLLWMGFDSGAYDLARAERGSEPPDGGRAGGIGAELGEAAGRRTAIGRAVEQALKRAAARPLSGIVILSDGRSVDEPSRAVMRRLQAEKIPVFTVALGSDEAASDMAIRSVQGPRTAFVNDIVPVEVEIERRGARGDRGGRVQLVDRGTGAVLDEIALEPSRERGGEAGEEGAARIESEKIVLTARPDAATAGAGKWVVRLVPDGPDLVTENNEAPVDLSLEDRPLRVLYFDGYPRWEYRYLKNLLVREGSISSSSLLLSEGRRFVQEGEETLASVPTSSEEWRQFDVIVIGDVRPDVFTTEQLEQIRDHVAIEGGGLLWVGGDTATPLAWGGTPLAPLLPFALPSGAGLGGTTGWSAQLRPWNQAVLVRPTGAAERYGVMRLAEPSGAVEDAARRGPRWWPEWLSDPRLGWPLLRWSQRIDSSILKPTAEVLAVAEPERPETNAGRAESSPLVLAMRFGAGRVLYVATDEIWRWRYGRGEDLPERFWLQLVRFLGRERLARTGRPARIEVSPARAQTEQPVRVTLELIDQQLAEAAPPTMPVRITRIGEAGIGVRQPSGLRESSAVELVLSPQSAGREPGDRARTGGSRSFGATWVPVESGRYRVEATDPTLGWDAATRPVTEVEVLLPEDELRHPETDHPLLARLSAATEGRMLSAAELSDLPSLLPNRRLRLVGTPEEETLWDTPLALMLLLTLLTAEWVGRRLIRLA